MVSLMKSQAQRLVTLQFILFALLAAAYLLLPNGQVSWARIIGIILTAAGLITVMVAILTYSLVNRNMVNVSPEPNANNKLVQTGIYAYVRHPIYTGVMLTAVGTSVAHGHVVGLIIAVILCLFFFYKSTFEEKLLMQAYPEYTAYRQRAGRFLPRLLG